MGKSTRLAEHVIYAAKAHKIAKASRFGIVVSAVLTFFVFAISYYGEMVGNFTFTVDRMGQSVGITIYENPDNPQYSSRLLAQAVDSGSGMTSLCGTEWSTLEIETKFCIPSDEELTAVNGSNNGESYIVYTFYLKNAGDYPVDLVAKINIVSAAKGAEESVRVRVIADGVGTTYAKPQSTRGTSPGELEPLTESFYSSTQVLNQTFTAFNPTQVMKVTVIIWYEGEDADHNINIVGGGVKMDMEFTISKVYDFS